MTQLTSHIGPVAVGNCRTATPGTAMRMIRPKRPIRNDQPNDKMVLIGEGWWLSK
jgi:hypothetical protein